MARIEHDSMGEVEVPDDALWRAQTQRAVENFPISGTGLEPEHLKALAQVKAAAAKVNADLGVVDAAKAEAIRAAAAEIVAGEHLDHFPIDVFQTGSGTSSNMNMNEVLATLAGRAGVEVHPNDHVNASQSSNDTFPTSIHVAATSATTHDLVLLDVDNGPDFLVHEDNAAIYQTGFLTDVRRVLAPGGVVAVWSSTRSQPLEAVLAEVFGSARTVELAVRLQDRDEAYWLHLGGTEDA